MNENLPELRDIHLPDGVSAWPPAYGWWVILLGIVAVVILVELVTVIRRKSKKLYALHLLKDIHCNNSIRSPLTCPPFCAGYACINTKKLPS